MRLTVDLLFSQIFARLRRSLSLFEASRFLLFDASSLLLRSVSHALTLVL